MRQTQMNNWQLMFSDNYTIDEQSNLIEEFSKFINGEQGNFIPKSELFLYGEVYNDPRFVDGEAIVTTRIQRIIVSDKFRINGKQYVKLIAVTKSGTAYHLRTNQINHSLREQFEDISKNGRLNPEPWHYVPEDFRGSSYM